MAERAVRAAEKLLPHNLEAEQSVLGSMMIDKAALHKGLELLRRSDFYRPVHEEIFEVLSALANRDEIVDHRTITDELEKRGKLEDIGGLAYIATLADAPITALHAESYARIVLAKSKLRRIISSASEVMAAAYEEREDAAEFFASKALDCVTEREHEGLQRAGDLIPEHLDLIRDRHSKDSTKLFSSGFPTMDRLFGKLGEAQFIVLKGLRGKGKTHCSMHLTRQAVLKRRGAVLYSLEMSKHQILDRLMACFGNVDSRLFKSLDDDDTEGWDRTAAAANELYEPAVYINDETGITVAEMHSQCRGLQLRGVDIGLVIIDFAELIGPPPGMRSEEQELKANAAMLRRLANHVGCTVVLLSQVNDKGGERGSRAIGNLADLLLVLATDDDRSEMCTLESEKNRFGPGFGFDCVIDKRTGRMGECAGEEYGHE